MIFSVTGTVSYLLEDRIVITNSGIGYEILVTETTIQSLHKEQENVTIFTHDYVREDQHLLYGFPTISDKNFFNLITTVSGMGPKLAMKVLDSVTAEQFSGYILGENIPLLTQISGIGKKMAERLIIELKDKIGAFGIAQSTEAHSSPANNQDLLLALQALGYNTSEIKRAFSKAPTEVLRLPVESAIKEVLKYL